MPQTLPTELVSLIFQFAPIVAPSKSLIQEAIDSFELSRSDTDFKDPIHSFYEHDAYSLGTFFKSFSKWYFGKTLLLQRCRDKSKRFSCLKYRDESERFSLIFPSGRFPKDY